jgi:hypothetical protein
MRKWISVWLVARMLELVVASVTLTLVVGDVITTFDIFWDELRVAFISVLGFSIISAYLLSTIILTARDKVASSMWFGGRMALAFGCHFVAFVLMMSITSIEFVLKVGATGVAVALLGNSVSHRVLYAGCRQSAVCASDSS